MQPRKLNIHFAFFAYGGNGGIATINPHLRPWWARTLLALKADPRIDEITDRDYSDTPIDMMRNQAVLMARDLKADVIVMIDSDNTPDKFLGRNGAPPFVPSSFDFLYEHFDRGPVIVAAPYGGPPPNELVYIFQWVNSQSDHPNPDWRLEMVPRAQAAMSRGIQEVAALPTGVLMADLRAFELTEPRKEGDRPWFHYEFADRYCAQKVSTEDVVFSRDISMAGFATLGYNPVFCNWNAWAGHVKQKEVGPPTPATVDSVNRHYQRAFERGAATKDRLVDVHDKDFNPADHPPIPKELLPEPPSAATSDPRMPVVIDRAIFGIPVKSLGFNTPPEDLQSLFWLAGMTHPRARRGWFVRFLEIGSWVGETAIALQRGGLANRPDISAYVECVDTWASPGSDVTEAFARQFGGWDVIHDYFLSNTKPLAEFIRDYRGTSAWFAAHMAGRKYDLIFIDANHEYESVSGDIELWLPNVRDGGILCGHDLYEQFPGVARAVEECLCGRCALVCSAEDFRVPGSKVWAARVSHGERGRITVKPVEFSDATSNGQQHAAAVANS